MSKSCMIPKIPLRSSHQPRGRRSNTSKLIYLTASTEASFNLHRFLSLPKSRGPAEITPDEKKRTYTRPPCNNAHHHRRSRHSRPLPRPRPHTIQPHSPHPRIRTPTRRNRRRHPNDTASREILLPLGPERRYHERVYRPREDIDSGLPGR